jgi:DNA-binding MarR family transcriptional regulator
MSSRGWPSPANPVSSAIYRVARAHRAYATTLLRDLGLYTGQEIMLLEVAEQESMTQRDLVRSMMLDHSTVAKSLRRLETAGLIARQQSQEDRRSVEVRLTDRGRDLVQRIEGAWSELEATTVRDLSASQRETAVRLMRRMERGIVAEMNAARES